jgi:hypothetical protein
MKEIDELKKIKEILENHEKRITFFENIIPSLKGEEVKPVKVKANVERLAQKINVDREKIEQLFDISNNSLTLLKVTGDDEREKTKRISLVVLLGYKYFFGNEQVLSTELRRNVAENRVSINNFATYLNELIPSLIRRIGKPKSPKTIYKLTTLGEIEAKEIIKKLCE